jgi:hypothetical protein
MSVTISVTMTVLMHVTTESKWRMTLESIMPFAASDIVRVFGVGRQAIIRMLHGVGPLNTNFLNVEAM